MAGLRFNVDADLKAFDQLIKKTQKLREEMNKLGSSSPGYDKLHKQFEKMKRDLLDMQKKFAEIQTALAQVDISKSFVDGSKKIRKETEESSAKFKQYSGSLSDLKDKLKKVTSEINSMSENDRKSVPGENAVKRYADLKAQLKVASDEMREFARTQENMIKVQKMADGSLAQLRRQLSLLNAQYDNLSRDLRNGATGKELLGQIQAVNNELNEAEQASMRFYRNVGNYKSAWNGIGVQVQQMARELPSLAIGANTFFLAISNNLPMLVDEIKRSREELAQLKAEGKQGVPVWKQLASSIFSWQTALVVGITLLSSHGKELGNWAKGLFSSKKELDLLNESLKDYHKALVEGEQGAQGEIAKLKLLYRASVDVSESTEERTKAINELQRLYPDFFKNFDEEAIKAGKAQGAYDKLTNSILSSARAKAAMGVITENFSKIIGLEPQINASYAEIDMLQKKYEEVQKRIASVEEQTADPTALKGNQRLTALRQEAASIMDMIQAKEESIAGVRKEIYLLNKRNSEIQDDVKVSDLLFDADSSSGDGGLKNGKKYTSIYERQKAIAKSEEDVLNIIVKNQINAQNLSASLLENGHAKELAMINANYDEKIADIQKREREMLQALKEAEYNRWKEANPDYQKKGLQFKTSISSLPVNEQAGFDSEYSAAFNAQQGAIDLLLSSILEKYKSYADKRVEIEKKINDDIKFLQSQRTSRNSEQIEKAIEQAEKTLNESLLAIDTEELKEGLNWEQVFGNLEEVSTEALKSIQSRLKEFIKAQKEPSPILRDFVEAVVKISDEISQRNPFDAMKDSFKALKEATDEEREAQEAYNKALKEGTDEEKNNTKATLANAKITKQSALAQATKSLHAGVNEIGKYVSAGNEVLGIMETLGIKTPKWLDGAIGGFEQVLSGLESINLTNPMSIVTGGLKSLGGALKTVFSVGGAIDWKGSNADEVAKTINRLTERNELLQSAIEDLTEEMEASKGTKSVEAYQKAKDMQIEKNKNLLEIAKEQARYHNSHGSWQHYLNWTEEMIQHAQKATGKSDFSGTSSLWELSPEQMKALKDDTWLWNILKTTGKGGYGERVTEKLESFIEQAGKVENLTESLYNGLTGMTFDGMYNSFIERLMDMKSSAEDAAKDMSSYFMKAMLANEIGNKFSDKLKKWWESFGKAMESDGLSQEERDELSSSYMDYVKEAIKLRDELASVTGYGETSTGDFQQDSSKRGFGSEMTHEDAGELSGRFTAMQVAAEGIKEEVIEQTSILNDIKNLLNIGQIPDSEISGISENAQDIAKQSLSSSSTVVVVDRDELINQVSALNTNIENMKGLFMNWSLDTKEVAESSKDIVKSIKGIGVDMSEVKHNTSKL